MTLVARGVVLVLGLALALAWVDLATGAPATIFANAPITVTTAIDR